jgi:hypothetical protein
MGDDVVESCRCEGSKVVRDEWNFAVEGLDPPLHEGGIEGLLPFLESKAILLDGPTARYGDATL